MAPEGGWANWREDAKRLQAESKDDNDSTDNDPDRGDEEE